MASTRFGHLHVHLQEFLYTRLFHFRMWCYALGVVAVVLRSWCVVMCTVCQCNSVGPQPQHIGHNTTYGSETTLYIRIPENGHVNVRNM